jgi:CCR4-NOT transcriptional regulation complex NOT5 subunit
MTDALAPNAASNDNAIPDKANADSSAGKDIEMKDITANKTSTNFDFSPSFTSSSTTAPNDVSIDKAIPAVPGNANAESSRPSFTSTSSTTAPNDATIDKAAPENSIPGNANAESSTTAPNDVSIDKAVPENAVPGNANAESSASKDIEMKDLSASETDARITNQEPEVENFLRGITDQLKWQELVTKWLEFENKYPIKGVFFFIQLF